MTRAAAESAPVPAVLRALRLRIPPDAPGCAVLVRASGRVRLARGFGLCELGSRAPIDARSNFRLGSLTKPFTAMATMLLVEARRLDYATPLADLLPGLAHYGRALTVRHLLTHTSGLPDFEALMAAPAAGAAPFGPHRQISDPDVLALLQAAPAAQFPAGSQWAYSNSGYILLGLIIEAVAGQPLGEFFAEHLFAPAGMRRSVLHEEGRTTVAERAYGHVRGAHGFEAADQSATSATRGDGGIYSNLEDLARWDAALESNLLVPAAALRGALAPVGLVGGRETRWPLAAGEDNLAPGEPVAYGCGWFVDPALGRERMWHFGQTAGFRTAIMRFPAARWTVAVLCNRADLDPCALALELAAAELGAGS